MDFGTVVEDYVRLRLKEKTAELEAKHAKDLQFKDDQIGILLVERDDAIRRVRQVDKSMVELAKEKGDFVFYQPNAGAIATVSYCRGGNTADVLADIQKISDKTVIAYDEAVTLRDMKRIEYNDTAGRIKQSKDLTLSNLHAVKKSIQEVKNASFFQNPRTLVDNALKTLRQVVETIERDYTSDAVRKEGTRDESLTKTIVEKYR